MTCDGRIMCIEGERGKGFQYQVPFSLSLSHQKGRAIYRSVGYVPKENVLKK
jgi:hypothetical protein